MSRWEAMVVEEGGTNTKALNGLFYFIADIEYIE